MSASGFFWQSRRGETGGNDGRDFLGHGAGRRAKNVAFPWFGRLYVLSRARQGVYRKTAAFAPSPERLARSRARAEIFDFSAEGAGTILNVPNPAAQEAELP
jgi:hypothetical protein